MKPNAIYFKDTVAQTNYLEKNKKIHKTKFCKFNYKTTDILLKMKTVYGCQMLMDHVHS